MRQVGKLDWALSEDYIVVIYQFFHSGGCISVIKKNVLVGRKNILMYSGVISHHVGKLLSNNSEKKMLFAPWLQHFGDVKLFQNKKIILKNSIQHLS